MGSPRLLSVRLTHRFETGSAFWIQRGGRAFQSARKSMRLPVHWRHATPELNERTVVAAGARSTA
jgi:hypothetical protein